MIKDIQLADCFQAGGVKLERVKYFQRQLLTVDDMVTDQDYFRQKMRRHNRFLHGWGVVCGLNVTSDPGPNAPLRVRIDEGYALGPFGDEIYVAQPAFLDLGKCGPNDKTDPCNPGRVNGQGVTGGVIYVAIQYAECYAQPVRTMAAGCGCEDDGCEYSRIRDSFSLGCLTTLPPVDVPPLICRIHRTNTPVPCPPCPTSPWVVLAAVTLPGAAGTDLAININVRKPLYRTELIQNQLIACCCGDKQTPPPPVPVQVITTGVSPAPNSTTVVGANNPVTAITVPFTKSLVQASVTNGFKVTFTGKDFPITVSYNDANHTATLTMQGGVHPFPVGGVYAVTVIGAGAAPITDTDGLALDGNADGNPGDNYAFSFTLQNPSTGGTTIPGVANPIPGVTNPIPGVANPLTPKG